MTELPPDGPVTLHVCVTCKVAATSPDQAPEQRGQPLYDMLEREIAARGLGGAIRLAPVECLSVCKRPATVAVSGPGRWTYVWGDLESGRDCATLIDGLVAYSTAPNGIIPWKQRPQIFKSGVVARLPPPSTDSTGPKP